MKFSPKLLFYLQLFATIGQGIAGGTIALTGLIPAQYDHAVHGWISLAVFCVMSFLTLATGAVGPGVGPLAKAPTVEEAQKVMDQAKGAGK